LTNLNQRQNAAKPQVERLHRQNQIIARIDVLKLRIPIARYTAARIEHTNLKNERDQARAKVQELQQQNLPLKQRIEQYEARMKGLNRPVESTRKELTRLFPRIKDCEEKSTKMEELAGECRSKIGDIRKAASGRGKKIQALKSEAAKLENSRQKCQENVNKLPPHLREELRVCSILN
jgi:chromosome segregation ATPase